jgi:uncharacterized protein (TIGR03435 family)
MQPGDRITMTNVTMRTVIQVAYPAVFEIVGGPDWFGTGPGGDRFDVTAKAEAQASREQLQLMLRTLLAERFKLVVHTQTRSQPGFALALVAKDGRLGPHLRRAEIECDTLRAAPRKPGERDPCGIGTLANAGITGTISLKGVALGNTLVAVARQDTGRTVIDKTGLTGSFDWELTWTPQNFLQRTFDRERFPSIDPDGPSIFTALQEQLGLKLESQATDVAVLVVDHVEHPTED